MLSRSGVVVGISLCLVALAGCQKDQPGTVVQVETIRQIISTDPQFSTLWAAFSAADMVGDLDTRRTKKTVVAPNNAAFESLGQDAVKRLLLKENQAELQAVLRNHIIDSAVTAPQLAAGDVGANELGQQLVIGKDGTGATTVDGARVIGSLRAKNGYVHVINEVLIPSEPAAPSGS